MKGPLLLESISKRFFSTVETGVFDLNLKIENGEGFALLGPSGCGKTTTLRMIGGFESPDQGQIFHGTQNITRLPPQKRQIRTVFQKYALFPHLSVFENIVFGLRMQKISESEIQKRAESIIELVQVRPLLHRPIAKLSGGEQQRVALARALVTEPSILLLDEPLSALDLKLREKMQLELLELRKKLGSTFIFVTHDQTEAMVVADRIAVMKSGKLQQVGTPQEIYSRPQNKFVASFIGQANFFRQNQVPLLQGDIHSLPTRRDEEEWMVRPESIVLAKGQVPAGFVGMQVRVEETAFLGQDRLAKVVDPSGQQILVKTPGHEPPLGLAKQNVLICWEPEDTWTVASN